MNCERLKNIPHGVNNLYKLIHTNKCTIINVSCLTSLLLVIYSFQFGKSVLGVSPVSAFVGVHSLVDGRHETLVVGL